MATYVLIHGAGDSAFYWHLLAPELRERGHEVVTMDLPCDDESAGLSEYADTVGMVPLPGEKGEDWLANTGYESAAREQDVADSSEIAVFYHDVAPALAAEALSRGRDQAETPGLEPWPLDAWPDVPTKHLLCRDDRLFPAGWMGEVVRERLGITPDEIDGGHCPALSRPKELAERLEAYRSEL
jgi:pimeloyl-ACP methyl ester carboxylesterase